MQNRPGKTAKPMSLGEAEIRLEAARKHHERETAALNLDLEKGLTDLATYQRWSRRWNPWGARIALVPVFALLLGGCYVVVTGLVLGKIKSFPRTSSAIHSRSLEPGLYWLSVGAYTLLTALLVWLALALLRSALTRSESAA